jgi:anti-anti-sigma factor
VDLDIKENGVFCTLKPKGRLVWGEPVNQFEAAYLNAISNGHIFLIIDLEALVFMDSSGIGSLVNALRTAAKAGGNVQLVKPTNMISKTLKMVGVLNLFGVFENEDDALAACAGS